MTLVVDASVAMKWFVSEEGSTEAATLLAGLDALIAPDLIVAEVVNAAWRAVRAGAMLDVQHDRVAARLGAALGRVDAALDALNFRAGGLATFDPWEPMPAPIAAPAVTLAKPCTLDAVPAMGPMFVIAIDWKLAVDRPKHAMVSAWSTAKVQSVSWPSSTRSRCSPATTIRPTSAPWLITRVPTRITMRALNRLATAIVAAVPANTPARSSGRRNVSNMICWTELR